MEWYAKHVKFVNPVLRRISWFNSTFSFCWEQVWIYSTFKKLFIIRLYFIKKTITLSAAALMLQLCVSDEIKVTTLCIDICRICDLGALGLKSFQENFKAKHMCDLCEIWSSNHYSHNFVTNFWAKHILSSLWKFQRHLLILEPRCDDELFETSLAVLWKWMGGCARKLCFFWFWQ